MMRAFGKLIALSLVAPSLAFPTSTPIPIAAPTSAATVAAHPVRVAKTVAAFATYHIHHVSVTLIKAVANTKPVGYIAPDSGTKWLYVTFHVVNQDDVTEQVGYNDIQLTTPEGDEVDQSYTNPPNDPTNTPLAPGVQDTGPILWEVPQGIHNATLTWHIAPPLGFGDGVKWPTYRWKVTF